jgi:hypothetical protein
MVPVLARRVSDRACIVAARDHHGNLGLNSDPFLQDAGFAPQIVESQLGFAQVAHQPLLFSVIARAAQFDQGGHADLL